MTKNDSTDLFIEQIWAIIAKLNLYTNENTRRVDSNGLDMVATTFKVSRTTVGRIKQEYWNKLILVNFILTCVLRKRKELVPNRN